MKVTIKDIDITGKRVLIRVDFNVPLKEGVVTDDTRIRAALPTITYALEQGASVILMSHLGRPKGKPADELKMDPVAKRLGELLKRTVKKMDDCVGDEVARSARELKPGEVMLLENLRFHAEETANDPAFAKQLAGLGEVYINDAFGAAHRAHASTEGVARYLPAGIGFLMEKEIRYLSRALEAPDRPFVVILGGAKVSDKIKVIENLLEKVDSMLIGGAMAYTFLKAQGEAIGDSLVEDDKLDLARELLTKAEARGVHFILPCDHVVARELTEGAQTSIVAPGIPDGWKGVDIGPKTVSEFKVYLEEAKTVLWNGPVGIFETRPFDKGTREIGLAVAELSGVTTIIGGGDSVSAVRQLGVTDKMSHVSTGGGASLEFLEGIPLPGIVAIPDLAGKKG